MRIFRRALAIILVVIVTMSVVSVGVEAVNVSTTSSNYGYMVPTNNKFNKTVSTVKLYGTYDYINFYIDSEYDNKYFFYEIYSDKDYTKLVTGDYVYCEEMGTYTWSPLIKLKGVFKSGTYYCITYAASMGSSGNVKLSASSVNEFKLAVDRTGDFSKQVVILKNVKSTVNGPQVSWHKHSSEATKYAIYRRSINGTKWTKAGTVNASTLSFTDKSAKEKDGNYVYTVKAYNKSGTASRYLFGGPKIFYAEAPVIKSVATTADNKIQIKWNKTDPNAYYRVYRKTNGGNWVLRQSYLMGTSYTDSGLENGNNYEYTVKAEIETSFGTKYSSYYNGNKVDYLSAPELGKIERIDDSLNISWEPVNGAVCYSVYRKPLDSSEKWTLLKKVATDVTSYQDTSMDLNGAYSYTVRSEGESFRGSYVSKGLEYYKLEQPEFRVTKDEKGIHLVWDEVPYAQCYYILRKNANGSWRTFTKTTKCYWDCLPDTCSTYGYSVQASRDNSRSTYKEDVETITYFPANKTTYQVYTGYNKLAWNLVGAEKYNLYKKLKSADDSSYELIYSGEGKSFADKSVEYEVAYTYQLRAVYNSVEQSENLASVNITRYSPEKYIESFEAEKTFRENYDEYDDFPQYGYYFYPVLTDAADGMKKTVYTSKGGGWSNTKNSYVYHIDVDADSSTDERKFGFMVYDSEGRTPVDAVVCSVEQEMCDVPKPQYKAVKDGLEVSWEAVDGAVEYRVKETYSTSFAVTVKDDGSSKYSVVIPASDFKYNDTHFILEAIHSNGNSTGFVGSGVTYCTTAPELQGVAESETGVDVYFKYPKGWDSERHTLFIFRKAPGESSWKQIGTANGGLDEEYGQYWDKTAKSGMKYVYTVRVRDIYKYCYASYFDTAGLAVGKVAAPKLVSADNSSSGVTVKWNRVYTADRYYVYRKTAKSSWERISTVRDVDFEEFANASYTDKTAKAGVTYFYTVRAFDGDASSGCDKTGVSVKRLTTPSLTSAKRSSSGVTVKWGKVTGANGYYVYRKTAGSGWSRAGTVKSGSTVTFKDTKAKSGTTYYYTVKAYSGSSTSAYVKNGIKCK